MYEKKVCLNFWKQFGGSNPNSTIMINWWSMNCHWAKVIVSNQQVIDTLYNYYVFDIHNDKSYQSLLRSWHH